MVQVQCVGCEYLDDRGAGDFIEAPFCAQTCEKRAEAEGKMMFYATFNATDYEDV